MNIRIALASAALAGTLSLPIAAVAQNQDTPIPSYAHGDESIHGKVQGFDGKYELSVQDERGFVDNVELHDGTIINPTGLRLAGGMTVTIYGHANGSHFAANEIDTPYHHTYAYGPGYGPYYGGYPYAPAYYGGYYGGPFYGPGFGVGIHIR